MRLKLDLQLFAQEKTEKATPKKRQDARKKGQVAKSMELPGAFILLFSFLFLMLFGDYFGNRVHRLFTVSYYEYIFWEITPANMAVIVSELILYIIMLLAPIFILSVVLAILGNYVQIGFLLTHEPLKMKLEKLNPIEGFKRIFSLRALVEFLKSMLKVVAIGAICSMTLWNERENILTLSRLPLEQIFSYTARLVVMLGLQIGILLVFVAVLDYMYQRYDHEKNLRMSKQDIKDEHKKMEGDPLIKSKIREKQRQVAMRRMMQEVPTADVVITNPTHYAVALRYEAEEMDAPQVVAKGKDYVALKIKEKAQESGVVTMENRPLARALYEQTEIGDPVPTELFQAVAEVLAYVYRMKNKSMKR